MYLGYNKENAVTIPHIAQRKHAFWGETEENFKSKKISPRKKLALDLLHHRLGHRYTRSLTAADNENVWQDTEPRIDPDHFGTACQI